MNEYIMPESINKLIGSPQGYIGYNEETLLDQIKNNPYSVLILDEIEKCNKSILNFFLNILDEGYALDNKGNKIRFDNVIIIMTTNAFVKSNTIGFNNSKKESNIFPKEFINRIDEIITFNDANIDSVRILIDNIVTDYNKKYNKKILLSEDEKNNIINKSDYKNYGYRKLSRLIKKALDNKLLETI
jgi:ATP-dependent Clp protease ATP-binding subunit ClpA